MRPHGLQPTSSSVHGIFLARVLEWGAIAFSLNINTLEKNNMLPRLVVTFLPRSKGLLISWLQSTSAVILGLEKIKSVKDQIVDIFVFGGHTVCAAVTQLGHPMKNKGTVDNMWRNEDGSVPIKLH